MARVLFLAYHFPPIGGGGVQRNAKFARYLAEFGHELVVVTGPGSPTGYWTPRDETLAHEIPDSVKVLRVADSEPSADAGWSSRIRRWTGTLDAFDRWWIEASASLAAEAKTPDVIYASLAPYETAFAAARLSAQLDRPWIADLQDPWAVDEIRVYPSAVHRRIDLARMATALKSAAVVVMNSPEAAVRIAAQLPGLARSTVVIPNGYDAGDFESEPATAPPDIFRIAHTGYLYTAVGLRRRRTRVLRRLLGGEVARADLTTRSHLFVVEAIQKLIVRGAIPSDRVQLHLAGVLTAADYRAATAPFVQAHGYVDHLEAVALMRAADLLFLPLHEIHDGRRSTIVPGKTYEYLASGRPVLGALPAGDARDLLERAPQARVCAPGDVEAIAELIEEEFRHWAEHGRRPSEPIASWLTSFERRELTRRLADVFDRVLTEHDSLTTARPRSG